MTLREMLDELMEFDDDVLDLPVRVQDEEGLIDQEVIFVSSVNGAFLVIGALPDYLFEPVEAS